MLLFFPCSRPPATTQFLIWLKRNILLIHTGASTKFILVHPGIRLFSAIRVQSFARDPPLLFSKQGFSLIFFNDSLVLVNDFITDNNTFMRQNESLHIIPIVPKNRDDVYKVPKIPTMTVVHNDCGLRRNCHKTPPIFAYLQWIINVAENGHMYANMRLKSTCIS